MIADGSVSGCGFFNHEDGGPTWSADCGRREPLKPRLSDERGHALAVTDFAKDFSVDGSAGAWVPQAETQFQEKCEAAFRLDCATATRSIMSLFHCSNEMIQCGPCANRVTESALDLGADAR
ncbi:hypothetical protein [Ensifer canadensis]